MDDWAAGEVKADRRWKFNTRRQWIGLCEIKPLWTALLIKVKWNKSLQVKKDVGQGLDEGLS